MSDRSKLLLDAMEAEFPDGPAGNILRGASLGSWEGPSIPQGLWEQQQWAGQTPAMQSAAGTRPLVRVNLPRQFARDWTVHFSAGRARSGLLMPIVSTGRVTLHWGHHGQVEEAQLQWPGRGGAVTVHGSFVEVIYTDTSTSNNAAQCWLDEGRPSRAPMSFRPCFTEFGYAASFGGIGAQRADMPVGTLNRWPLAARARSMLFAHGVALGSVGSTYNFVVQQRQANLGIVAEYLLVGANAQLGTFIEMPIHHWATLVDITNVSSPPDDAFQCTLSQYLDLG